MPSLNSGAFRENYSILVLSSPQNHSNWSSLVVPSEASLGIFLKQRKEELVCLHGRQTSTPWKTADFFRVFVQLLSKFYLHELICPND